MNIAWWDDDPQQWDRLIIGPFIMPGVWDVDYDDEFEIEVKKGKGRDGARLVDHGHTPTEMTFRGRLVTSDDWSTLQSIIPQIWQRKIPKGQSSKRVFFEVTHPKLQLIGVQLAYISKVGAPKLDNGIMSIELKAIEYVVTPKKKPTLQPTAADEFLARVTALGFAEVPDALDKGPA